MRLYEETDREEIIKIAYRHLGTEYANSMKDIIDKKIGTIYVLDTKVGIRSFIVYIEEETFNILAFTDLFDKFTIDSYRKFREIIMNRNNTIVIHFSKNKEVLERAIKPYGGYVLYNYIIVPKKER